jgi:hypothetical protein
MMPLAREGREGADRATIHEPGDLPSPSPIPRSGTAGGAEFRRGDTLWRVASQ